jgi:hypothetical protein
MRRRAGTVHFIMYSDLEKRLAIFADEPSMSDSVIIIINRCMVLYVFGDTVNINMWY